MGGGGVDEETVVEGALEVADNAMDVFEMWETGIMHEEANLLDRVGELRASEGHVLQGSS